MIHIHCWDQRLSCGAAGSSPGIQVGNLVIICQHLEMFIFNRRVFIFKWMQTDVMAGM